MKKKEIRIKKNLLLAFVLLFALQINFMDAKAAGKTNPWGVTNADWTAKVKVSSRGCAYFSVTNYARDAEAKDGRLQLSVYGVVARVSSSPLYNVAKVDIKEGTQITPTAGAYAPGDKSYVRGNGIFSY